MPTHPLVFHSSPDQTIAWRDGAPVTVRAFVADVARVAAALPPAATCSTCAATVTASRSALCAALVAGKISLLPSTHTPEMVRQLASFAPDAFCLHDAPDCAIDLPRFAYPDAAPGERASDAPFVVPQIDAARIMAYVFTSGSTGAPVPHRKTRASWSAACARRPTARLLDGRAATLIGTVPAQHMYGFESTVLLALIGGLAFSNRQPFYPVDIRDELAAIPQPRVLVTSPIHLRALLAAGQRCRLPRSCCRPPRRCRKSSRVKPRPRSTRRSSRSTAAPKPARSRPPHVARRVGVVPGIRLDARDEPASDDGEPTIWVSGGHVEAPVPMGDALELLGDGRFLLHGRKADLVNIAGKRTSLACLNHQLNAIAQVIDGVFFMPDEAAPAPAHAGAGLEPVTRLVALVVAPTLAAADLQRAARERIDPRSCRARSCSSTRSAQRNGQAAARRARRARCATCAHHSRADAHRRPGRHARAGAQVHDPR